MPDAAQIMRTYERSKPGRLDMGELMSAIRNEPTLAPYRPLLQPFQSSMLLIFPYDTNGSGYIETAELGAMIQEAKPRVTYEDLLAHYDANKTGTLESDEIKIALLEERARLSWRPGMVQLASGKPVRAAFITMTAIDTNYQAGLEASDFTAVLQEKLSVQSAVTWVSRAEVKEAESVIGTGDAGLSETALALRVARSVQADWVVTAHFGRPSGSSLRVEAFDVKRVDVLVSRGAYIPVDTPPTTAAILSHLPLVAAETRGILANAAGRWNTLRSRPKLALLTLLDAESMRLSITSALESGTNSGGAVRVLNFQRAADYSTEPDMLLFALAKEDPAVCEKLADAYAWGQFNLRQVPDAGTGTTNFVPLVQMMFWDGHGDPQTFSLSGEPASTPVAANEQLPQLGSRAAQRLSMIFSQPRALPLDVAARANVSKLFLEQAKNFRASPDRWSRPGTRPEIQAKKESLQEIRLLETAYFFNPGLDLSRQLQSSQNSRTNSSAKTSSKQ